MSPSDLWRFLIPGYLLSILIETPVLLIGLSKRHSIRCRLIAGVWLTACTYPIVVLVLPLLMVNQSRGVFLLVAETFAPLAECALFWLAFGRQATWRDFAIIVVANLASFVTGEFVFSRG